MRFVSPFFLKNCENTGCAFTIGDCNDDISQYRIQYIDENVIPTQKVRLEQIHSGQVIVIESEADVSAKSGFSADGLITNISGIALEISVADCASVALVDDENKIIALVHAGWRGTEANIIENALDNVIKMGATVGNICAYIGPSIGFDDYEVGKNFLKKFPHSTIVKNGRVFFDLAGEIKGRLNKCGIENVEKFPLSTYSTHWLESYRRDGDDAGRILFYLWIK